MFCNLFRHFSCNVTIRSNRLQSHFVFRVQPVCISIMSALALKGLSLLTSKVYSHIVFQNGPLISYTISRLGVAMGVIETLFYSLFQLICLVSVWVGRTHRRIPNERSEVILYIGLKYLKTPYISMFTKMIVKTLTL